jgi:hypothetical protein
MTRRARHRLATLLLIAPALAGCTYQKDVNYKPFFTGLDGAQMQTPPSREAPRERSSAEPAKYEETTEDGEVILYTPTIGALIRNIGRVMAYGEQDAFEEYLLSDWAKDDALARGREVGEIWDALQTNRNDIRALFARMPMAERTPGALLEPLGHNTFKLRLTNESRRGLRWSSMTAAVEGGQWKLIWFGS